MFFSSFTSSKLLNNPTLIYDFPPSLLSRSYLMRHPFLLVHVTLGMWKIWRDSSTILLPSICIMNFLLQLLLMILDFIFTMITIGRCSFLLCSTLLCQHKYYFNPFTCGKKLHFSTFNLFILLLSLWMKESIF